MATQVKFNAKRWFSKACLLLFIGFALRAEAACSEERNFHICLTQLQLPQLPDRKDIRESRSDSAVFNLNDTINFRRSKDSLTSPVNYHADDSLVVDVPGKKLILYGKASRVSYQQNEVAAPFIEYNQTNNIISAYFIKDSLGNVVSYPAINQEGLRSVSDTIQFNMKTMKGLTRGTYTQQGEMFVYGTRVKKVSSDVFYVGKARLTTCDLDTPHFAFVSSKIKFIQGNMAVSGPVHPEVEGVPLPVVLPFGIYPLNRGRHSGFMAPTFTANQQLGLALEGLGYYKVLSDNWDLLTRGTIYSYGGWAFTVNPRYYKRYRYQGNFSFDMQRFKTGFKGDPDFSSTQTINIRWSHNMDSKAHPGVTFSANVNAGSSKFNEQVPNNPTINFTNQLNSSITYSKVWKNRPYNISISANHNQNTLQRLINLNLPDIGFNVNTLYPFRRKEMAGNYKWYENIGVALNTNARSLTSFYDTAADLTGQIARNFAWGASHSIPVTLSLPPLGVLQLSPSVSYSQRWYQKKILRSWDAVNRKISIDTARGFYMAQDVSFGMGMSTRVFGMFTFGKKSRVQAIRHEIRPFVSANYRPDINRKNFYSTQIDTFGNTARYGFYEGSIFGAYGEGKFGGLSFGIDNNLQMKVRSRNDSASVKKVSLLDGFGVTGSYNFLQDSFQLSILNMTARSNLFEKVSITANASFDPYVTDSVGRRIDKLVWKDKLLSLGTLTGGSVSMSSSFHGGDKDRSATLSPGRTPNVPGDLTMDQYQQQVNYMAENPAEFVDFKIPWSIDLSYSLRFNRIRTGTKYSTQINQDVNWNASMNLTSNWKLGINGFYNISAHTLGTLSMYMSREMHCWQMAITVSPVGLYKYFSINISPKSGILRDLKINRTRYFYSF